MQCNQTIFSLVNKFEMINKSLQRMILCVYKIVGVSISIIIRKALNMGKTMCSEMVMVEEEEEEEQRKKKKNMKDLYMLS